MRSRALLLIRPLYLQMQLQTPLQIIKHIVVVLPQGIAASWRRVQQHFRWRRQRSCSIK